MALSQIAQLLAREISAQDWSDAHSRLDGSRHDRKADRTSAEQLESDEADAIRMNVVWVTAQALSATDPNFSVREFAEAAGVASNYLLTRRGAPNGMIEAGLRRSEPDVVLTQTANGWSASRLSPVPNAQLSLAHASTPELALQMLLAE